MAAALVVAGWGANQFTPLSVVYRIAAGWATLPVVAMFTIYLVGLVPTLLLGSHIANRLGRRPVVRLALAAGALASALLASALTYPTVVYVSRLATGLATGLIVSVGGIWLKELSGPGSRGVPRIIYATGAGFAVGPLVAGAVAEWLPRPTVLPCLLHAALALAVLALTSVTPETAHLAAPVENPDAGDRWSAISHPRFVGIVLPASPAIFAAATVSYVVLPPLVVDRVRDHAPLFSGMVAAVTLTIGLAVQPLAARIDRPGSARATLAAMATVVAGLLLGALAVEMTSPTLVVSAAVLLGAGYGLTIESGLAEIRRIASPSALPTAAALFQGVAHSGFLAPLFLAVSASSISYPRLLLGLALVGAALLAAAAAYSRHTCNWAEKTP